MKICYQLMQLSHPVAYVAVRSRAVVLLLLIHCFVYVPLFVVVLYLVCFEMHYFVSHLDEE